MRGPPLRGQADGSNAGLLALRKQHMGVLRDGRKGPKAVRKKAVKCAFPAGEFFTASAEIFVALDDQERSSE